MQMCPDTAITWASFSVYRSVCIYLFLQVTHKVFQKVGLFETFKIPMDKFLNFFFTLENGYHKIPCKYHVYFFLNLIVINSSNVLVCLHGL